jgi:hypothetical protein
MSASAYISSIYDPVRVEVVRRKWGYSLCIIGGLNGSDAVSINLNDETMQGLPAAISAAIAKAIEQDVDHER